MKNNQNPTSYDVGFFFLGCVVLTFLGLSLILTAVVGASYCISNKEDVAAYFWNLDGVFQREYRRRVQQSCETYETDNFDPENKSEDERVLWAITSKDKSFLNQREQELYTIVYRFKTKNQNKTEYEIVKAAYDLVCEKARCCGEKDRLTYR